MTSPEPRRPPRAAERAALRWLLAALGAWIAGRGCTGETAASSLSLEGDVLARMARLHNLGPVLHAAAEQGVLPPGRLPPALLGAWEEAYFRNFVFNSRLLGRLDALLARAAELGVELTVIKGPVAIARLYRDPALRVLADLDLLCHESDLGALAGILLELGLSPVGQTSTYHQVHFDPELQAAVELHFDLYEVIDRRRELLLRIHEERELVVAGEVALYAPTIEQELTIELGHAIHHDLVVDLRRLLDLALGLRQVASSPRWDRFLDLVATSDLEPELALVCDHLRHLGLLPPDSPAGLRGSGAATPARELEELEASLLALEERSLPRALAGFAAQAGLGGRAFYLWRLLVPDRTRRRALAIGRSGGPVMALARHLRQTVTRGWRKLGQREARTPVPGRSVKAELHRRRARRASPRRTR